MKKSKNIIVSLILVLLIVIFVSKTLEDSYLKITSEKVTTERIEKSVLSQSKELKLPHKEDKKGKDKTNTSVSEVKSKK